MAKAQLYRIAGPGEPPVLLKEVEHDPNAGGPSGIERLLVDDDAPDVLVTPHELHLGEDEPRIVLLGSWAGGPLGHYTLRSKSPVDTPRSCGRFIENGITRARCHFRVKAKRLAREAGTAP